MLDLDRLTSKQITAGIDNTWTMQSVCAHRVKQLIGYAQWGWQ